MSGHLDFRHRRCGCKGHETTSFDTPALKPQTLDLDPSKELAVFTRFSMEGTKNIHFLPVWLAPWFLALLTSDLVGVTLLRAMAGVMAGPDFLKAAQDSVNEAVSQLPISLSPDLIRVIWQTLEMTASFAPYYLCALPTVLVLQWKIRSHGLMLQQMRSFDARTAQCSLESDRALLQQETGLLSSDFV